NVKEAKKYYREGHFPPGSMGPKIRACIRFIEWGGEKAIITSLDKACEALEGKTGTVIRRK
ncbi:MAG: carbamate kinase, partial [Candidatus Methanomethylicia archaeon]